MLGIKIGLEDNYLMNFPFEVRGDPPGAVGQHLLVRQERPGQEHGLSPLSRLQLIFVYLLPHFSIRIARVLDLDTIFFSTKRWRQILIKSEKPGPIKLYYKLLQLIYYNIKG